MPKMNIEKYPTLSSHCKIHFAVLANISFQPVLLSSEQETSQQFKQFYKLSIDAHINQLSLTKCHFADM